MGATSTYGWPLPDGDDPPDLPYWMQQLGDAIDTSFLDTGWVNVTIASGFVAMASELPQCRRIGKAVYLRGGWLAGAGNGIVAATSSYYVGTLPVGFRPPLPTVGVFGSSAAAAIAGCHIQADGQVQIRTSATLGSYYKMDRQVLLVD